MQSYCVKERKQTDSVPGSERYVKTKNNRNMLKCKCALCGITKTKFVTVRVVHYLKGHHQLWLTK